MKILSIDTSSKNCSICISSIENNIFKVIISKNNDEEKTHSQKLMPLINEMFNEANLSLDDIDLLACAQGPGSFTGIRIGIATVKAFADVKNIPVVGVTSLESLSYNVSDFSYIIPIIDAKNNNVYSAIFSKNHTAEYENIADTIYNIVEKFSDFLVKNNADNICFIGDGSIIYKDLILEKFANTNIHINFSTDNIQSSISLAKCAYQKYKNGLYGNSDYLLPLYLKKSQAERIANGEE